MKTNAVKPVVVILAVLLFQAFTFKASPVPARAVLLGTISSSPYTIYFNGPASYCGPISGLPDLTVSDGTNLYTAIGQTGTLCYDSGTGSYYASGKVKFYDANEELIEIFFDEELQ